MKAAKTERTHIKKSFWNKIYSLAKKPRLTHVAKN